MEFSSRKLAISLGVSIALNLFLLGVLTRWWGEEQTLSSVDAPLVDAEASRGVMGDRPPRHRKAHKAGKKTGKRAGKRARRHWLNAEQRAALKPSRKALRRARQYAQTVLAAEPVDSGALEEALTQLREKSQATQQALHQLVQSEAPRRSVAERKRMLRGLRGSGKRRHGEMRKKTSGE